VHVQLGDLPHPLHGDSLALLPDHRMIRVMKLKVWPKIEVASNNVDLQIERLRVARERVREPTEVGRLVNAIRIVPKLDRPVE
jgi:hypothetical protein